MQIRLQMDPISDATLAPSDDEQSLLDDSSQEGAPYGNLLYFAIVFGFIIGIQLVYQKLKSSNESQLRDYGSRFPTPMTAGDELAYQALYGGTNNNNGNDEGNVSDRVRQRQRTNVIQTADEVMFDISPMGSHPRRRITVMSKTQPALLRSFEPTNHEDMVCALCLEPLDIRRVAAFPCNHPMHEDCFREWIVKTSRLDCPLCAQDFSTYDPANPAPSIGEAAADTRE